MGLISDSFANLPPDDDDLRPPVTPGLPAADPSQAPASLAASPAPVSFYAANSPDSRTSGRFVVGPRRLAGDPAPLPAPDPTAALTAPAAPALPAPAVAAPSAPPDPTRISSSFGAYFGSTPPAYSTQTAPAPAIGSKLDDNIDPDTAVSLGLPDASAATGTPSAPPAPAAAVKVPSPGLTSAPPAPNDSTTSGSGTDDISSLIGGGQDPADAARQQYARDHAADLKHFKAQGGMTTVDATGAETPLYDDNGGLAYKPTTINPVTQLGDERFYRIDRTATGNYKAVDLLDEGANGSDYHTSQDGSQFVQVPTGDGLSRRVVIGQDPLVQAANDLKGTLQDHEADHQQAALSIAQAQSGVPGAGGYGAYPLSTVRGAYQDTSAKLTAAQGVVSQAQAVMGQRTLTPDEFGQYQQATSALAQYTPQVQALSSEMDSRQSAINQAQQQRNSVISDKLDTQRALSAIQAAQKGSPTLENDLTAVVQGQDIPLARAALYAKAGLLAPQPQADGSTGYAVTKRGTLTLGKDAQQQLATSSPGQFALADDAMPQAAPPADASASQTTPASEALTTPTAQQTTPIADPASSRSASAMPTAATAVGQNPASDPTEGQTAPASQTQPATPQQTAAGDSTGAPGQSGQPVASKPYSIGGDGTVKFDASQPMTSLTSAYKAGAVSDDDFKTLLPQAQAAEAAQAEQKRIQGENPAAWKAALSGAASGTAFLAGAAPGSGIGTEIGAGLGALTGPFAEIGVPVGATIGNVAGGYIGGKLASSAFDAAVAKAGQNNATIRSFQDAAVQHPYWTAAGGVVSAAAGLPKAGMQAIGGFLGADGAEAGTASSKLTDALAAARATEGAAPVIDKAATLKSVFSPSNLQQAAAQGISGGGGGLASTVSNLTQEAAIRAAQGASTADIAKIIGYRVGGASLGMLAMDTALKEGSKALGFSQDGQTLPGAAQAALMGAFMSGHGLQFGETSPAQMANIVTRVGVRLKNGIPLDQPITAENLPPGVDNQQLAAIAPPLTPHEMVLSSQFDDQIKGLASQGKIDPNDPEQLVAAARQSTGKSVFHNGQRQASGVQVTPDDYSSPAASASAPAGGPSTPATPLSLPGAPGAASPIQGPPGEAQTSSTAPASSSLPPPPSVPSDALIGLGKGGPASSPSTGAPAAGQAQQQDQAEPTVTRSGGMSTIRQGNTSLTVPVSEEARTVALMRGSAQRQRAGAVPIDVDATETPSTPSASSSAPSAPVTFGPTPDAASDGQVASSLNLGSVLRDSSDPTQKTVVVDDKTNRDGSRTLQLASASENPDGTHTVGTPGQFITINPDGTLASKSWQPRYSFTDGNGERQNAVMQPTGQTWSGGKVQLHDGQEAGWWPFPQDAQSQPTRSPAASSVLSTPGQAAPSSASAGDPALTALTKLRDGQAAMIQGGKFSPDELPTAQAMLDHLNQQVARARQPAADLGTPAAPATPDAAAPAAPAPASDDGPPTSVADDASGSAAVPRGQPADTPLPATGDSVARPEGSTPAPVSQSPASAPTAYHQRLADTVNSGALSDHDDGQPSTTFHVLSRLRNFGAEVTPELARDVSTGVSSILGDTSLDRDAKQAALKQLFRDNLPSEQHQDAPSDISSSSGTPAPQNASDLQRTSSGTGTAPATGADSEPDEPQPPTAPRQTEDRVMQTAAGPKLVPADTDDVADARSWLAEQRDLGRNPASAEVARQTGVDLDTASRLRADQQAAETQAAIPETPEVPHIKMGDKILADPARPPWTVSKLYEDGRVGITSPNGVAKAQMKGVNALAKKVQPTPQAPAAPPAPPSANGSPAAPAGDGSAAPATTYSRVVGQRIDNKTTAFSPESGTLGIPRNQMPQVASEHRGAMAQFLQARGMQFSAQDELPGSLKPSQAEFNPGKVAKAGAIREAGDATPRRILTSSDGHVIDGHHQWLDRLQNTPDEPMPTLKINAPARDILRRVHEFPSANMEKAPDIVSDDGGETSQSISQAPAERQPVGKQGKQAVPIIKALEALQAKGRTLTPEQERMLDAQRLHIEADVNRQALGSDAKPTTEAGKRALANLQQMESYKASGGHMKPGDYDTARAMNRVLQNDFTAQRQAIEAKQPQPPAPSAPAAPPAPPASSSPAPTSAPAAPTAATSAPTFKPRQEVVYKGRPAVVESIDGDRAVVRVRAGQHPTTGANLVAKKVTGVPVSALQARPEPVPSAPITIPTAAATAQRQIKANRELLKSLGVAKITFGPTDGASGVEIGDDGTLRVQASKLAASMTTVRDNQARNGIAGTPEDWFSQVLFHEGIHAADIQVAKAKGQTIQQRYEELPAGALPQGWQDAGRDVYGAKSWDALPEWKQKAEFVRQVVEGKWTGRITEQIYKFIKEAIDFLKSVAGFKDADPRFKAHVEEVESRIAAARETEGDGSTAAPNFRPGGRASYGRRAATIQSIDGDVARIQLKGSSKTIRVPVADLKPPIMRRFVLPSHPSGQPDIVDHIAENGGMRGSVAAKRIAAGKGLTDGVAGDYDDRPNLKPGVYTNAMFGGQMTPDQMASALHEDYGHGDGTVPTMYSEIDRAMQSRESGRAEMQRQAAVEKQATNFDRDALTEGTAKGGQKISAGDLSVGEKVQVGDQTLKVIDLDPDTMDVTLEDHSKYGVQTVADGQTLYVEKVERAPGDDSLPAARPDRQTMDLFPEDKAFDLRGEALPDAERVAAAKELARQQPAAAPEQPASPAVAVPRISPGERGTGDLFQGDDAPFNLQGEEGIDGARVQQQQDQAARDAAEAKAIQARDQGSLFAAAPETSDPDRYRPATPEERKALRIPPAWTEVHIATDPNASRVAVGKDGKGRIQSRYSEAHTSAQQAAKFNRLAQFDKAFPSILDRIHSDIAAGGAGKEEAAVLRLIQLSGFRNGGDSETGGKVKAYGASNLRAEHVRVEGDTSHFDFMGKLGVRQQHSITDAGLARDMSARAAGGGALFNTNSSRVLDYLKGSGDFKVHDFRTWNATNLALRETEAAPRPTTAEEFWNERDRIGDLVAKKLGDTRKIVLESYIDPTVFEPWKSSLNITDEARSKRAAKAAAPAASSSQRGGAVAPSDAGLLRDQLVPEGRPAGPARSGAASAGPGGRVAADSALQAAAPDDAQPGDTRRSDPTRLPDIKSLVNETTGANAPQGRRYVGYSTVNPEQAEQLKADTGLDLAGYRRNLDNMAVRHVLKNHGDPAAEIARGNAPMSKEDFERLPQLLDHPDASLYAGKNARGHDVILSAKRVNGHFVIVEEARDGKQVLNLTTLYKKSAPPLAMGPDGQPDPALLQSTARATLLQASHNFNLPGGPNDPSSLAAAVPDAENPLFEKTAAPADPVSSTLKRGSLAWAKAKLAEQRAKSATEDAISAHKDAAGNMADIAGRQANESVQLDIPNDRDRQAAGPVVEAGGDRARLAADLAKVQASPNKKLAAKYAPIYQHAVDNLPRLNAAADGYRQMDVGEDAAAERAGLPPQWQVRTKHLYDDPTSPESTIVPDKGFGATRGFKTAADAIAAGVDPKSTDLGDLAQRRVQRNQQAINTHAFQKGLADLKASDGKPIIGDNIEASSKLDPDGKVATSQKTPAGYESVQAGPNVLTVHKEFAPLLRALYGESGVANDFLGKHLLDLMAIIKHAAVGVDTYHGFQVVIRSLLGHGVADYKEGLAGLRFADADLDRAVKAGKISQADADATRAARHIDDGLLREGLNVGKAGDNLLEAARQHNLIAHIPVLGKAATWVNEKTFHEIQPGFMRQAARAVFARNQARFPELSEQELFRRTAREVNEFYGNLGSQGFLKSKTMQDLAKLTLFAPGFTEGRFRTEARGIGQAARVPVDGFSGRGWRLGTVAQAMGGIVLASLIGNQVVNMLTRGKPTWENEEDGHKLDAWIPGGAHGKGFFFSPLSIAAEYSHSLIKYMEHRESAVDSLAHIAGNKLSGGARAVKTLVTGTDYKGQPFASMGERLKAAATEMLPLPMQLSPWINKNPKGVLGLGVSHEKGSLEKQLLASAGLRVDPADSARSQMFNLAQQFRGPQPAGDHGPSAYAALRTALGNEDADGARAEIQRLVTEGHKTLGQVADKATGIKDGKVHPELFTGSREKDLQMLANLTPAQKQVYRQAFQDRVADARLLAHLIATMPADQKRALQMASAMNGRGNKTGAAQVGKSSVLQAGSPAPSVPAQPAAPATRPRISDSFR